MIPLPKYHTLHQWADQLVASTRKSIPVLHSDDWQDWASQVLLNLNVEKTFINPYNFSSWSDWAERFIGVYDD